jgi:hypothetical protein
LKYKHIQLISLLIDFLTARSRHDSDNINNYLADHGIRYPEKALRELALEVQERMTRYE